jgi:hypothetical protein
LRTSPPAARSCRRNGSATASPTVIRGLSEPSGFWKTIWSFGRSRRIAERLSDVSDVSPKRIAPDVGSSSLNATRPSVDLPQPDSPTSPSVVPRITWSDTPSTARSFSEWNAETFTV